MKSQLKLLLFLCSAALTPKIVIASDVELSPLERLGKEIFFDKISSPDSMACATCHEPASGWTGPIAGINKRGSVYRGAIPTRFGNRKPPSAAYATFSPILRYDAEEEVFIGGNFWDGRATGFILGNPAADQALGPFLNPVEQNNPNKQAVLKQIAESKYARLWLEAWGEPITDSIESIDKNYERVGLSIAAYEASDEVNQFSSKYDAYLSGDVQLTSREQLGMELFNGKGNCAACHPSEPVDGKPPLLTDFTYDNLGMPKNPQNPFYGMDSVYLDDGSPINPSGYEWVDRGLGGYLAARPEWAPLAVDHYGKHKVPTLRNVDKRNGKNSPKAYGHNGFFKSLKSIVHFYNTRDVKPICIDEEFVDEQYALAMDCWPLPEVSVNVNKDELGSLGLTEEEEDAIVAFMKTLSDGYKSDKSVVE